MGTKIQWTEATWNPVVGCSPVSEGCRNCYAARLAVRLGANPQTAHAYAGTAEMRGRGSKRRAVFTGKVRLLEDRLHEPLHWRKPRLVFVNSMSDLFHESVPDGFIDRVFAVMALAPHHTFQVLTKRPERMAAYMAGDAHLRMTRQFRNFEDYTEPVGPWPLPNVWLGVSVEDQAAADERIPHLLRTPAAVRFLSCEPLLGPVDLSDALGLTWERCHWCGGRYPDVYWADDAQWAQVVGDTFGGLRCPTCFEAEAEAAGLTPKIETLRPPLSRVDWVIVGGESGPRARPCDVMWIESIVEQCRRAAVPVFVKQLGARPVSTSPRSGKAREIDFDDPKGSNPAEWPEDLRVQEFPEVTP